MITTINGSETEAEKFAFDGCHKIYILETPEQEEKFVGYGYDIHPISFLHSAWRLSCPLRFISSADLEETFISQAYEGEIEIKVTA